MRNSQIPTVKEETKGDKMIMKLIHSPRTYGKSLASAVAFMNALSRGDNPVYYGKDIVILSRKEFERLNGRIKSLQGQIEELEEEKEEYYAEPCPNCEEKDIDMNYLKEKLDIYPALPPLQSQADQVKLERFLVLFSYIDLKELAKLENKLGVL